MSRIRRISRAATAATAVLALAIPTSASAISINAVSGDAYKVAGRYTLFLMSGVGGRVFCNHNDPWGSGQLGRGIADGQASTPFEPLFPATYDPTWGGGCEWQDETSGGSRVVTVAMQGAFMLTLDGLMPGQNPLSPRRSYNGRLWLHPYSSLQMRPARYPGCTITIAGPQSTSFASINVDDASDEIGLDAIGATFTTTKTASCPSGTGNSAMIYHPPGGGWTLQGVTVTP